MSFLCLLLGFPGKGLSTEQFLMKLPKMVIKGGKVIDIRDSLRNHLKVSIIRDFNRFQEFFFCRDYKMAIICHHYYNSPSLCYV